MPNEVEWEEWYNRWNILRLERKMSKEFVSYFRGSLLLKADSLEEAWEKWQNLTDIFIGLEIDDVDIL